MSFLDHRIGLGPYPVDNIKQKLIDNTPGLFVGTPVLFAYLYGSIAKDLKNPFSDLDIAVFTEEIDRKKAFKLELSFSLAFDELLCHTIESEIRTINYLPLSVQGDIITTGVLIYCRDDIRRVEFETNLRMSYFDFLPAIRRCRHERIDQIIAADRPGKQCRDWKKTQYGIF